MKKKYKYYLIALPVFVGIGIYVFFFQAPYRNKINKIKEDKKILIGLAKEDKAYQVFSSAFPNAKAYYTKDDIENYKGLEEGVKLIGIHCEKGVPVASYSCRIFPQDNSVVIKLGKVNVYPTGSKELNTPADPFQKTQEKIIKELKNRKF